MEQRSGFPPTGFLLLGVLSLASAIVYLVRAIAVEATAERMWSAALFAVVGVFWIWAFRDADTGPRS